MTDDDRHSELETILGSLPVGLWIGRADGSVVFANEAGKRLAGAGTGTVRVGDRAVRIDEFRQSNNGLPVTSRMSFDVTDASLREEDLFARVYFDELTGLPNRRLIERSVAALIAESSGPFALAFLDIDGFKHINDYYGHSIGDTLLVRIAERISRGLRPSDMLARVGGDEFVLLLSPIVSPQEAATIVEGIAERLKKAHYVEDFEILSSASFGVGIYPKDGDSYEVLRSNADSAMYRSKGAAKGGVWFFDSTIAHAAAEKARSEQRLRLAIRDKRLLCAYQPKVDFRNDTITGIEVLLRWRDEDGVIRAPGDFIALALELGLMDDVTFMILAETRRAIDRINEAFGESASISINVAAVQASNRQFMRSLVDAIERTGTPKRYMLEITEEAFLASSDFQRNILPMVREIGTRVSVDDFGVGYSSLSALAEITADELKVDRSFITDVHKRPRSQAVLRAIESLGRSLSMSIVVEGVETFEELAYLQAATRIHCAQGFYFSRPIVFDDQAERSALVDEPRSTPQTRFATGSRR
ncbi:MAG: EAL domain-containing protein [Ancalomicrobiaceae bacterium]|nr:EAL domain-containing protein [Ancalomicrobiaceae bacterium]